jgi:hypothetical protein
MLNRYVALELITIGPATGGADEVGAALTRETTPVVASTE